MKIIKENKNRRREKRFIMVTKEQSEVNGGLFEIHLEGHSSWFLTARHHPFGISFLLLGSPMCSVGLSPAKTHHSYPSRRQRNQHWIPATAASKRTSYRTHRRKKTRPRTWLWTRRRSPSLGICCWFLFQITNH